MQSFKLMNNVRVIVILIYFFIDSSAWADMVVDEAGNVGIGVESPRAHLHVKGNNNPVPLRIGSNNVVGNEFTMDIAAGTGLVNLVAGAQINQDGNGYNFLGTRGASRIALRDTSIAFYTSTTRESERTAGVNVDGFSGQGRLTVNVNGITVNGGIHAANSDIYFTKTDHIHSGTGNTEGHAAIENAADFKSLMILGRTGGKPGYGWLGRYVRLWDYLQVNGGMDVTGRVGIGREPGTFSMKACSQVRSNCSFNGPLPTTNPYIVENCCASVIDLVRPVHLDVNGYVRATNIALDSDVRFKEDIKDVSNALNRITKLRGVSYKLKYNELKELKRRTYKKDSNANDGTPTAMPDHEFGENTPDMDSPADDDSSPVEPEETETPESIPQLGLVAQEVEEIFPEAVLTDQDGYKSIAYMSLIAPIIESIKILKSENEQLKTENQKLRADINQIKKHLGLR